jgi:hypothetical protein
MQFLLLARDPADHDRAALLAPKGGIAGLVQTAGLR